MRWLAKWIGILLLLMLAVVVARTVLLPSKQIAAVAYTPEGVKSAEAAQRLAGSIPFQTVWYGEGGGTPEQQKQTLAALDEFHAYLEKTFPRVYEKLGHEVVGQENLLFTWKGSDPSLKPMLIMGHQDEVPIEAGTESKWTHAPFSGEIADGYVWGRGTMDDRITVVGALEAVDTLLAKGYQPKRTVYLAFGQDEEIGGLEGAEKIAQLLKSRGVKIEFLLDEGGFISLGLVPGVTAPVAMVGNSEKGYLSLVLTVETIGGHSAVPPPESSIGILANAVRKIEKHPWPAHVHGSVGEFLEYAGGSAGLPMRAVYKNMWLFGPVVQHLLEESPDSNATLRTTAAVTVFNAGLKDNVMPSRARAIVNFRLLPGDTIAEVMKRTQKIIDDPRVKMAPMEGEPPTEATPESPVTSPNFATMQKTIKQVYPDAVTAPFVFVGALDAKHYASLTPDLYRFVPLLYHPDDVPRFHGTNERVSIDGYGQAVEFYCALIRNGASN